MLNRQQSGEGLTPEKLKSSFFEGAKIDKTGGLSADKFALRISKNIWSPPNVNPLVEAHGEEGQCDSLKAATTKEWAKYLADMTYNSIRRQCELGELAFTT